MPDDIATEVFRATQRAIANRWESRTMKSPDPSPPPYVQEYVRRLTTGATTNKHLHDLSQVQSTTAKSGRERTREFLADETAVRDSERGASRALQAQAEAILAEAVQVLEDRLTVIETAVSTIGDHLTGDEAHELAAEYQEITAALI